MKEHLEHYVKKVKDQHKFCEGNEATTKASLIAPLFVLLGWDMTHPKECMPEYRADFGKGEKAATPVDWAFALRRAGVFHHPRSVVEQLAVMLGLEVVEKAEG